jgi:hypothetical protein
MEGKLISIIKILAVGFKEIIIDIELQEFTINSIEIDSKNNIILHRFESDMDIEFLFDEISQKDKDKIYKILSNLLYN